MKLRFYRKFILLFIFFILSNNIVAQKSIIDTSTITDFNNALKLYNNKAYGAAQKTFEKVKKRAVQSSNLQADASYYDAMCAIKLNQTNADEKVLNFVE